MSIFNSLGSNYKLSIILNSLIPFVNPKYKERLIRYLEKKYGGKAYLFYKGREALEYGLRGLKLDSGSKVVITGFTCHAVYQAVISAGLKPVFLDIEKNELNFSFDILKKETEKNPKVKVVILQNTLGYPKDAYKIKKLCKEKKLFLVEDLAHSVGAQYGGGKSAGDLGDLIMFSFSQDKLIDGVSGGALIIKTVDIEKPCYERKNIKNEMRDWFYPLLTFLIRKTYSFGFGKAFHLFLRKANMLSGPMTSYVFGFHKPSNRSCKMALLQLDSIDKNLNHRRKIANIYLKFLDSSLICSSTRVDINKSSNMRFPIFVKQRSKLISVLKKKGIYISDIWYDAPIAPKRMLTKTKYKKGMCPNAEEISDKILNLPTHVSVSEKEARRISRTVNSWLNT